MKLFAALLLTAATCGAVSLVQAQTVAPSATPSVSDTPSPHAATTAGRGDGHAAFASLTPEERQKLETDRQACLNDPEVIAAGSDPKARHRAMFKAMVKHDPSVGPILKKLFVKGREDGAL